MSHFYAALKSTAYSRDDKPIPVTRLIRVHKNKYSKLNQDIEADRVRKEQTIVVEEKKPYIL